MVTYERRGPVAVIGIERPEARHAVDTDTAWALNEAWHRFETDDEATVGVLVGGEEAFSAGGDLKEVAEHGMRLDERPDEGYLGFTYMNVEKPTIAAIEGWCVAGGLEMAAWCDVRIASTTARFSAGAPRFAIPIVDGASVRLPRILGTGRALDLLLTGRTLDAGEARDWGLVTEVVDEGEALERAVELGERIAELPRRPLLNNLRLARAGFELTDEEAFELEVELGREASPVAREEAKRFLSGEFEPVEEP